MGTPRLTKISTASRDLIVILLLFILVYLVAGHYDLFERIVDWVEHYEAYELDEMIVGGIFLVFAFAIYGARRHREARATNQALQQEQEQLKNALDEIKLLKGVVPICSMCKKIRDDEGFWQQVERYIEAHSQARFSHSMCPECLEEFYGNEPWFHKTHSKKYNP